MMATSTPPTSYIAQLQSIVDTKSEDAVYATWYNVKGNQTNEYTFKRLWDEAGYCAYLLRNKWNVNKGDRVVLCYDFGLHFIAIFLGCLRAGVTAVIVYPPAPPLSKSLTKMTKVIDDCCPKLILTESSINMLRLADLANFASKSRPLWPSNIKFQVTDCVHKLRRRNKPAKNNARHSSTGWSPFASIFTTTSSAGSVSGIMTHNNNEAGGAGEENNVKSSSSGDTIKSFDEPDITGDDLAFLQYTSGSTGDPKGVMVTHSSLHANVVLAHAGYNNIVFHRDIVKQPFVGFSWLPQYHDMGLILMILTTVAAGCEMHMMSPVSFIRNPLLWIELMSKHKCHMSGAPDFAYQLVVRKYNELKYAGGSGSNKKMMTTANHSGEGAATMSGRIPARMRGVDLSMIHHMQNAAEPTRLDTKRRFEEAFKPHGLHDNWFTTAYGLAEHVVSTACFVGYHLSRPRGVEDPNQYISIGIVDTFHESMDLRIVDPITMEEKPENETGEIWLSGPSVTAGYYGKEELTQNVFRANIHQSSKDHHQSTKTRKAYLRTGDLGFIQDGHLFICGRQKDIIIVNGVNYYPQDVEHAVQDASEAVRPGCVAAFSSDETGNDGNLEIVFEVRSHMKAAAAQICEDIRVFVMQQVGLTPSRIVAIEERTIAKTTSGKIQRRKNRTLLHDDKHKIVEDYICPGGTMTANDDTTNIEAEKMDPSDLISSDQEPRNENTQNDEPVANQPNVPDDGDEARKFDKILRRSVGIDISTTLRSKIRDQEDNEAESSTWDDIGLSSMAELELRTQLERSYSVVLPENCFQTHSTPFRLKSFVESSQGTSLPTVLPSLKPLDSGSFIRSIRPFVQGFLQCVGAVLILFIFALPIIPAFEIGKILYNVDAALHVIEVNGKFFAWMAFPIVIPIWMVGFTILTIAAKWIVIGKYRAGAIGCHTTSPYFLRWWFVDRTLHLWEQFVGFYIVGTPLMTLFCVLMGANVHCSATIDAYIREFDLVSVAENASIEESIRCRMFGQWKDDGDNNSGTSSVGGGGGGASLRFRPISVNNGASIKGMLCPGSVVGGGSTVARLAVAPEGAQIPSEVLVAGNPGFMQSKGASVTEATRASMSTKQLDSDMIGANEDGNGAHPKQRVVGSTRVAKQAYLWWHLGILKILWLTAELYFFFAAFLLIQIGVQYELPSTWRYSNLLHWTALLGLGSLAILLSGVILKWLLIGKKRPGPFHATLYTDFVDWAVDYHFKLGLVGVYQLTNNSRAWNMLLMMYGMDIDMISKVNAESFTPSQMDLISIESSFVSSTIVEIETEPEHDRQDYYGNPDNSTGRRNSIDFGDHHVDETDTTETSDADDAAVLGKKYRSRVVIKNSSVGLYTVIGPGSRIEDARVSPLTYVKYDAIDSSNQGIAHGHNHDQKMSATPRFIQELEVTLVYLAVLVATFASMIPAYELWMTVLKPKTSFAAVPVLVAGVIAQNIIWMMMLRVVEHCAISSARRPQERQPQLPRSPHDYHRRSLSPSRDNAPNRYSVYQASHSLSWAVGVWSVATSLLWGTPMMNAVLRSMGCDLATNRVLYMGFRIYEFSLMSFGDRTVIDESLTIGHYAVFGKVRLGRCHVSGLLHRNSSAIVAPRNPILPNEIDLEQSSSPTRMEVGPQQLLLGNAQ